MLSNDEREKRMLDLYNQGKNTSEMPRNSESRLGISVLS
jgi:hypothetical protein